MALIFDGHVMVVFVASCCRISFSTIYDVMLCCNVDLKVFF
jgi:hypothetical protein